MGRARSKQIKDLERYVDRLKYELPTPKYPKKILVKNPKLKPLSVKNGQYSFLSRQLIIINHKNKCDFCGYSNIDALEIHHTNGNHFDNNLSNIAVLCSNCHTLITKGKIQLCPTKEPFLEISISKCAKHVDSGRLSGNAQTISH